MEEVAQHNSELDCWTVIGGKIYNIAPFVSQHPGGKKILKAAGKDGTELFSKIKNFSPYIRCKIIYPLYRQVSHWHQIGRNNVSIAV